MQSESALLMDFSGNLGFIPLDILDIVPILWNSIKQSIGINAQLLISSNVKKINISMKEFLQIFEPIIQDTSKDIYENGWMYVFVDNLPESKKNSLNLDPSSNYIRFIIRKELNLPKRMRGISHLTKNIIKICHGSCLVEMESADIINTYIYLPAFD